MNVKELSKTVAEELNMPEYKVRKVIIQTFRTLRTNILKAQVIRIRNFMTFYIDVKQPREYFSMKEGKMVVKPRHFVLKVLPSKLLKKEIGAKKTY